MKRMKVLSLIVMVFCISACVNGQIRRTVYGNNDVVTEERRAGNFSSLRVSSGIDVFLKQGSNESILVEADENLHDYILTEIRGDVLQVYTKVNIRKAERKRVYVTMRDVNSITASSAGDVIGESPIESGDLELSASSAGDIKLEVYADEIKIRISSSGDMTLSGNADMLDAHLSSAGDLNAFNLKVREADVSVSSAGDADINVSEKITARASSAGDINYRGNPRNIDAHSSSAGGIHRR